MNSGEKSDGSVIIIGAGPAGLTAAYFLSKHQIPVVVLEADEKDVGGISRTVKYEGFRFDIGGHRFYSKSEEIENLWREILSGPEDFVTRQRSSRIYYRGKFFTYPLKPVEALLGLGFIESIRCGLSYLKARMFPNPDPANFEEWVTNQFGARLFSIFFKTYTEKVWGMPCTEISADWAAQRIKGLSLGKAVLSALFPRSQNKGSVKTLISEFHYPRLGPGMLWEACAEKVKNLGGEIHHGHRVSKVTFDSGSWTVEAENGDSWTGAHVISTAAIRDLSNMLHPSVDKDILSSARSLQYRDFVTVAVMLKDRQTWKNDQWIYIHDPSVQVGRIQNYKEWSPDMIPDPELTCYGLEYFCFEKDTGLWAMSDEELETLAAKELAHLGLVDKNDIVDTVVVRQKKAYPVYDDVYAGHVSIVREYLEKQYPGLHLIGRNGMHKYNNQDHSMMTAILCVENILAGDLVYDLWKVNEDAAYGESGDPDHSVSGLRSVPRKINQSST